MFKIFQYTIFIFFLSVSSVISNNNIFIYASVNDQIITNYDIKKESEYLKMLNPNLKNLEDKKILKLAKNSLINEIIKKKEVKKIFDLESNNEMAGVFFKNLYQKLNFDNEIDFKNNLLNRNSYKLDEIKKKIKIEVMWNDLIYSKYINQVQIDKSKLNKKIENLNNKKRKEYFLSEILFEKNKDENIDTLIDRIKSSITEIGFKNSANIFSISESANLGGQIGWISENSLSEKISKNLSNTNEGEITDVIKIGNNYLILKLEKVREINIEIDKKEELEKMIKFETNKILNQYSRIYFNKAKLNYTINEK